MQIFPGEIATIIGASGGGKTTLMRCATTLEYPNSGNISFAGITVCRDGIFAPPKTVREARKMFGMVFQSFNLFPHYSVWRNITDAPLNILRIAPKKVKEDAERMLEVFNLMSRKDAYPCELSNGQQQRVAIIRALLLKPRIMFFDEPTSALDPKMTRTVIETKEMSRP